MDERFARGTRRTARWMLRSMGIATAIFLAGCGKTGPVDPAPAKPAATAPAAAVPKLRDRTLKIRLKGNLQDGAPKAVTVSDLERLPQTEYAVRDPYLKTRVVYRGVLVRDLVAKYGGSGTHRIRLRALDDYKTSISRREWSRWDVLLATHKDGQLTPVADNGPARIVFPYDTTPEIQPTVYDDRWIWQIVSIEFVK